MITANSTLSYERQTVPPIIQAVQGDTGRNIAFKISDYEIPEDATATFYIQKPSGNAIYNTAEVISSNQVLVPLDAQCLAEVGENFGQVRILLDDEVITSFDFILLVKVFHGVDAIESLSEMNVFDQAVADAAADFQTEAEQIAEEVIESIPEDYTELSNDVNDLKQDLGNYNAVEVFKDGTYSNSSWRGITLTWSNKVATLYGTATGGNFTSPNIYYNANALPSGISAGDLITVNIASTDNHIVFEVIPYVNGSATTTYQLSRTGQVLLPSTTTGLLIRLMVSNGVHVDGTLSFGITTTNSNQGLSKITPYVIGDTGADVTNIIEHCLSTYGAVILGKGTFNTSGITMPDNTVIKGFGRASKLTVISAGQNAITVGSGCAIEDIEIVGTLISQPTDKTSGSGIRIIGNGDSTPFVYNTKISGVTIHGFGLAGIYLNNTGLWVANGASIDNCEIYFCYAGMLFENNAEFHKVTNCIMRNCYSGVMNVSGNNIFTNCSLSNNQVGYYMAISTYPDTSQNNGHGALIGCTIDHSNNNTGYGILVKGSSSTNGFLFADCHLWYSKVQVEDMTGVLFNGCVFGGGTPTFENYSGAVSVLNGCVFKQEPSFSNYGTLIKNNCYMFDGTPIT